jgi:hypothetical protein
MLVRACLSDENHESVVSPDWVDNSDKNSSTIRWATRITRRKIFWLLHLQHRRLRLNTLGGSPPRTRANYRQCSGARHQLALECEKSPSKPATSSTSTTRRSQQRSGARQQLRLWSWLWFYDNNSPTSTSSTTAAPTTPHPIKAKFSSFKSQLSFTFATPDTRGLRHEQSSCISLTSKNCESPSS